VAAEVQRATDHEVCGVFVVALLDRAGRAVGRILAKSHHAGDNRRPPSRAVLARVRAFVRQRVRDVAGGADDSVGDTRPDTIGPKRVVRVGAGRLVAVIIGQHNRRIVVAIPRALVAAVAAEVQRATDHEVCGVFVVALLDRTGRAVRRVLAKRDHPCHNRRVKHPHAIGRPTDGGRHVAANRVLSVVEGEDSRPLSAPALAARVQRPDHLNVGVLLAIKADGKHTVLLARQRVHLVT